MSISQETLRGLTPGLVLTRRVGEIIFIELPDSLGGHRLQVSLVSVDTNSARIGIRTPRDWNIARGEQTDEYLSHESIVRASKRKS